MSPCKITAVILPLTLIAFAVPAAAAYVELDAAAAESPLLAEQAPERNIAADSCSRQPDDVLVNPATGLRNCEAATMAGSVDGRRWWGGPRLIEGVNPPTNMSPNACWRHPDDVLVSSAAGRRNCEE